MPVDSLISVTGNYYKIINGSIYVYEGDSRRGFFRILDNKVKRVLIGTFRPEIRDEEIISRFSI